jgi:hypothetical protein
MNLTNLVRLIGALVVLWTLVAIGIGASGVRLPAPSSAAPPAAESPSVDAMPATWPRVERYDLIDRISGRKSPLRVPEEGQWSLLSISPWRGPDGELEAAGRWVSREREGFCGLGLFRLSDRAVLSRVAANLLPSGRPCWVPGLARTILFPGADGGLHFCRLAGEGEEPEAGTPSSPPAAGKGNPDPLVWAVPFPGDGEVFLEDPIWPDTPRMKKWVVVALSQQVRRGRRCIYAPPRLWWLEMSEGARLVVAAGRLAGTSGSSGEADGDIEERSPSVAVGPSGETRLVYLSRSCRRGTWRLRSALVDFDGRTGRPRAVSGDGPVPDWDAGLVASPLVLSTDGATVFGLSRSGALALPVGGRPGP